MVALTGTLGRTGAGHPTQPASTAAASQRLASGAAYSTKGENSPQPCGPRSSIASRRCTPRKRTRIGTDTTRAASCSSARVGTAEALTDRVS